MEKIVTKINCPHCGAPIANTQRTGMIKCLYCNQTFQRNAPLEKENDIQILYIPPSLSDEDCKLLVIRDLVFIDNVPIDIFDNLEIDVQAKKLYPFYVYHLNWSANWSATCSMQESYEVPKYDSQGRPDGTKTEYRTRYRDYNGNSAGTSLVFVGGSVKRDDIICLNELCNYYTNDLSELFFANAKDFDVTPEDWNYIEVRKANDVYQDRRKEIDEYLYKSVYKTVWLDAGFMASGWVLERVHPTYNYHQIKNPNCVFRPIWEMKCKYNSEPFGVVVDISQETFFLNMPQNETEKSKIKELDATIEKCDHPELLGIGSFFAVVALIMWIVLIEYDERVIFSIIFLIAIILIVVWATLKTASSNAKEEKKSILSNSMQKRKAAALRRFGSNQKLVELIESVQKNQDKE